MAEVLTISDEEFIRQVARDEIASLCGLVLRRLQDDQLTRSPDRNMMNDVIDDVLSSIFGEALQEFSND